MPKKKTTYTIFLSAPSDVSADVELLKQVILDLNILFHSMGLEFESFHWLDNVTPGATNNAQDRINAQAEGYDIIVALLGSRLGTPTEEYESGTVEEIERCLLKIDDMEFGDDSIIVAFKNVKMDTVSGDLEEAARVQKYRKSLSGRVLYKEYEDDVDLRTVFLNALSPILHQHIISNHVILEAKENIESNNTSDVAGGVELVSSDDQVDDGDVDGILDLVISSERSFGAATQSLNSITDAVSKVGSTMERITQEMSGEGKVGDIIFMARSMKEVAGSMNNAADVVELESASMKLSFDSAISDIEKVLDISHEDFKDNEVDTSVLTNSLELLYNNITSGLAPVATFREMLLSLPKIDKGLNKAKIKLMKSLDILEVAMRAILDRSAEVKAKVG